MNILEKNNTQQATDEKARAAVSAFRALQPTLTAYARAMTGRSDIRVELASRDNGSTDGQRIFYRPPIALGEDRVHDKSLCNKRDTISDLMLCPACAAREKVLVTIYHEISHNVEDTFTPPAPADKRQALQFAVREVGATRRAAIEARINSAPRNLTGSFIGLAGLVNEFLPIIVNALEDARVNANLFKYRPGCQIMFKANSLDILKNGYEVRSATGEIHNQMWNEAPLNSQAIIGILCMASGYTDYEEYFHPKVASDLLDPDLNGIVSELSSITSVSGVYKLSFKVLERLRDLGYCVTEQDPADKEEEDEQDNQEPGQDSAEDSPGNDSGIEDQSESGATGKEESSIGEEESSEEPFSDGQDDSGPRSRYGVEDDSRIDDDSSEAGSEQGGAQEGNTSGGETDPSTDSQDGGLSDDWSQDGEEASDDKDDAEGDNTDCSESKGDGPPEQSNSGESSGLDSKGNSDSEADGSESHLSDDEHRGEVPSESDNQGDQGSDERSDSESNSDDGSLHGESPSGNGDQGGYPSSGMDGESTSYDEPGDSREGEDGLDPSESLRNDSTDTDGRQPQEDLESERGVDESPLDTGADDGYGGTELIGQNLDIPEYGDQDEADQVLKIFGDHDEKPKSIEEVSEEEAVDRAIVQGMYFTTPSYGVWGVWGVTEHRYGDPTEATDRGAWSARRHARRVGQDSDTSVPETYLGPALGQLRRAFSDNQLARRENGLKAGKINTRALGSRAWSGDERLFRKNNHPGKKDYSVEIAWDISGSNQGINLILGKRAVMAHSELLSRAGVEFEVFAHTGSMTKKEAGYNLDIYWLKERHESLTTGIRQRINETAACAANLDGHALEFARKRLDTSQAKGKIILYYSDGKFPAANSREELEVFQREQRVCAQKGITLLGVGIRTDSPKAHGLDTVEVHEDGDLIKVIQHLGKRLNGGIRR